MGAIATQITSLTIVYSTVYSGADQSKHQSSASLAFVWGIHRGPVNSPHKWPVTRKMFPFDDVIMYLLYGSRKLNHGALKAYSQNTTLIVRIWEPNIPLFTKQFWYKPNIIYGMQLGSETLSDTYI